MQKVFYIEPEEFLRMMVEKRLKGLGLECYTAYETRDCAYMVRDIAPDLLVFEIERCFQAAQELITELAEGTQIPMCAVGFPEQLNSERQAWLEQWQIPWLPKPLAAKSLLEDLTAKRDEFLRFRESGV